MHFRAYTEPVMWLHLTSFPVRAASGDVTSSNPCVMACSLLLPRNMPWAVPKYYFDIWIWGVVPINNSWKNIEGIGRAFNWLKCLSGFLHLKPTAEYQISTLIFEKQFMQGGLYKYSMKNILRTGKVHAHLGFQSKVFPGPLTDLSAWVGFCTSSPQQGVKYQLWYLIFFYGGGGSL